MTVNQDAQAVAKTLLATARTRLGEKPDWEFARVLDLVKPFVKATKDVDQVELVLLHIFERNHWAQPDWVSWDQYSLFRRALAVPPGAWGYARWAYDLHQQEPTRLSMSVDHWLGVWSAAKVTGDHDREREARESLRLLREHALTLEEASW